MLNLDDLLQKSNGKLCVYQGLIAEADEPLSDRLTVVIPDMHLLEKKKTDDFWDNNPDHEQRFLSFLDFLVSLRNSEGPDLEIIQIGDLYDLWQARGDTNLISEAYPDILGNLDWLSPIYILGNHDFDLVKYYAGQTFGRKWRYFSPSQGKPRVIFEHGYQADFFNNSDKWSGTLGRGITQVLGMAEYLYPDVDVFLGSAWDSVSRTFTMYNGGLTPNTNPEGFNCHEYLNYYINLMEKYNRGDTSDQHDPTDLSLAVVGHTHLPRLAKKFINDRAYFLLDCGSWVNGGHEIGVIAGKHMAICQWG